MWYIDFNEWDERFERWQHEFWIHYTRFVFFWYKVAVLPRILLRLSYWVVFIFFLKKLTPFWGCFLLLNYLFFYRWVFHPRSFLVDSLITYHGGFGFFCLCRLLYVFISFKVIALILQYFFLSYLSYIKWQFFQLYLGFYFPFMWPFKIICFFTLFIYILRYMNKKKIRLFYTTPSLGLMRIWYMFFFCLIFTFWGIVAYLVHVYLYNLELWEPYLLESTTLQVAGLYFLWWHMHFLDKIISLNTSLEPEDSNEILVYLKEYAQSSSWIVDYDNSFSLLKEREAEERRLQEEERQDQLRRKGKLDVPEEMTVESMIKYHRNLRLLKESLAKEKKAKKYSKKEIYIAWTAKDSGSWEVVHGARALYAATTVEEKFRWAWVYTPAQSLAAEEELLSSYVVGVIPLKKDNKKTFSYREYSFKVISGVYRLYYQGYYDLIVAIRLVKLRCYQFLCEYGQLYSYFIELPILCWNIVVYLDSLIFDWVRYYWHKYPMGVSTPLLPFTWRHLKFFLHRVTLYASFSSIFLIFLSYFALTSTVMFSVQMLWECTPFLLNFFSWTCYAFRFWFIFVSHSFSYLFVTDLFQPFTLYFFFFLDPVPVGFYVRFFDDYLDEFLPQYIQIYLSNSFLSEVGEDYDEEFTLHSLIDL